MSIKVVTRETFDALHRQQWNDLMSHCQAPVFYRSDFLQAFECWPLHAVERIFYLLGFSDDGQLQFAFPAYLQRGVDPMRVLANYFPAHTSDLVLLSHVWHCYDTCLPARELSPLVLCRALEALGQLAGDVGAALFGFVNVEASAPLALALDKAGRTGIDIDRRFVADLSSFACLEDYFQALERKERQNMCRYVRRLEVAGGETLVCAPADGDLDGFVVLARAGAEKYHNANYYQPGIFQQFVRALGQSARLMEVRYAGALAGAGIVLCDDIRTHFWVCGSDYTILPMLSPFYLTFLTALQIAISSRTPLFEMGRRNEALKLRYGLLPRVVRAYLMLTEKGGEQR